MKRPIQPEWASEEESRLADEWLTANSDLSIDKYIWEHASKRLRDEYNRQSEAMKGMHLGHVILPDGDILVYN